jgi:hypothetical protein
MKSLAKFAAGLILAAGLSIVPALAQDVDGRLDAVFGEHETFRDAYDALTAAVAAGDSATVASLVKYPFEITIDGEDYLLRNEDEFTSRYDDIFTPDVAGVVTGEDYNNLFVNQDGVMFGDGQLWLTAICPDSACNTSYWVISAINIPE